jgi:hypothetical protein
MAKDSTDKLAAEFRSRIDDVSDDELRDMAFLLMATETDVVQRLAAIRAGFTRQGLERLISEIQSESLRLGRQLRGVGETYTGRHADVGADMATEIAERAGVKNAAIRLGQPLPGGTLSALADYKGELLTKGITERVRAEIVSALRLGFMTGKTPYEIMQQVAKQPYSPLSFGSKIGRAEVIVRTEGGRVAAKAHFERSKDYEDFNAKVARDSGRTPEVWLKKWLSAQDTRVRPTHVIAHGGPAIPLSEDFIVGGEACSHPHDPRLSAKEAVNCRCIAITIPPGG